MNAAIGFWLLTIGYALVYTGGSWFVNPNTAPTLAQSLGLSNLLGTPGTEQGTSTGQLPKDVAQQQAANSGKPSSVTSGSAQNTVLS